MKVTEPFAPCSSSKRSSRPFAGRILPSKRLLGSPDSSWLPVVIEMPTRTSPSALASTRINHFSRRSRDSSRRARLRLPVFRRPTTVRDALRKLDTAVRRPRSDDLLPRRSPGGSAWYVSPSGNGVSDLEWVLAHKDQLPIGLRRGVHLGLAKAHAALGHTQAAEEALRQSGVASLDGNAPVFVTDWWMTADDGFRFTTPRLLELAPGVHVAQGYDFSDFAFITTPDGVVAVDAGTTEAHAAEALAAFRASVSDAPIKWVILTHARWDHIGGLRALQGPHTQVIAQRRFADELAMVNSTMLPFRHFFASETTPTYTVTGRL